MTLAFTPSSDDVAMVITGGAARAVPAGPDRAMSRDRRTGIEIHPRQHASRPANRNPGGRETGKPGKQPLQADLAFSPRQRSTDTVVATTGEGEVPPGILSGDVERVRIGEDAGIAVRGGQDGSDRLADADRLPRELGRPAAYPGRELNRGFQPEDLVDRIRPHTGFASRTSS